MKDKKWPPTKPAAGPTDAALLSRCWDLYGGMLQTRLDPGCSSVNHHDDLLEQMARE